MSFFSTKKQLIKNNLEKKLKIFVNKINIFKIRIPALIKNIKIEL